MKATIIGLTILLATAGGVGAYSCVTKTFIIGAKMIVCVVCTDSYGNTTVRCL